MTKTATIHGVPVERARMIAELTNATGLTCAECSAYVLEDGQQGWFAEARPYTVRLSLVAGYSSNDHLFDRAAARAMEQVDGQIFRSEAEIRKVISSVRHECRIDTELLAQLHTTHVPAELEAQAEIIRSIIRAADAKKQAKKTRTELAGMHVAQATDGVWVVLPKRVAGPATCGQDRWYSVSDLGSMFSYCGPHRGHATQESADKYLVSLRAKYGT